MKKLFPISLLLIVLSLESLSQVINNEKFVINHGPYLQNMSSSGVTIIWTTNKPAVQGVNLTTADGKTRFVQSSHDGIIDGGGLLHKVRVNGLEPGKTYKYNIYSVQVLKYYGKYMAYRIDYGDTLVGKAESFTIPFVKSEKIGFTVVNDVHEDSGKLASYFKNGNVAAQDLYFFNGDMVNSLQETTELFPAFIDTAVAYFASMKPFYFVRGNHETKGFVARDIKNYFDYKDERFYYSFDNGPVHFVVLDCGEVGPDNNPTYYGFNDFDSYRPEELEWLKKEVKSNAFRKAKYRIVMIHLPINNKGENQKDGPKFLSDNFGPILQTAKIDLMLSGHFHKNLFFDAKMSSFGYPVLINSNKSFVEVVADNQGIKASVKDINGEIIADYKIK